MKKVPQEVLKLPVTGLNLDAKTLGGQIAKTGTLLVFLRHFG
ncbi:MAG TPA: hypothetical protein PKE58_21880 [Acidobacteriota bacterium]|nr:hypothetical protein [Acidobacteriota bacterium]